MLDRCRIMLGSFMLFFVGIVLMYYGTLSVFDVAVSPELGFLMISLGLFTNLLSFIMCYSWTHQDYERLP